ncbi:hypothetical protein CYLTODRAFT_421763 [Cylindrobasidium torrendii FP15055 ss-10]|uniref:Uncharacterized protein n=1 Tax=Cylindrobasidium torrendii FP15055 ss-10 TaxID=1314674 RepID=A0A0D7BCL2_9AGAR|nr:hypothetical protein CYLTODRAFT_421763 [Cylindrobasidium torrendii FP15055 ss-10]
MASVDDLPFEIIQSIFKYATNCEYQLGSRDRRGIATVPLQQTVLQVSCRWNQIATATPRLWSCIIVGPTPNLSLLPHILRRSGTAPLDMDLSSAYWDDFPKVIISESFRWRRLVLPTLQNNWPSPASLRAVEDKLPMLESLTFDGGPWTLGPSYTQALSQAFRNTPALCKLNCTPNLLGLQLPWERLVELQLNFPHNYTPDMDRVLSVLESPNLFKIVLSGQARVPEGTIVYNSSVRELELPDDGVSYWLNYLSLPALRKAKFKEYDFGALHKFIKRSQCQLNTLIDTTVIDESGQSTMSDLKALAPLLEQLRSLEVHVPGTSLSNPTPEPFPFADALPSLVELTVGVPHIHAIDALEKGLSLFATVLSGPSRPALKRLTLAVTVNALFRPSKVASIKSSMRKALADAQVQAAGHGAQMKVFLDLIHPRGEVPAKRVSLL